MYWRIDSCFFFVCAKVRFFVQNSKKTVAKSLICESEPLIYGCKSLICVSKSCIDGRESFIGEAENKSLGILNDTFAVGNDTFVIGNDTFARLKEPVKTCAPLSPTAPKRNQSPPATWLRSKSDIPVIRVMCSFALPLLINAAAANIGLSYMIG